MRSRRSPEDAWATMAKAEAWATKKTAVALREAAHAFRRAQGLFLNAGDRMNGDMAGRLAKAADDRANRKVSAEITRKVAATRRKAARANASDRYQEREAAEEHAIDMLRINRTSGGDRARSRGRRDPLTVKKGDRLDYFGQVWVVDKILRKGKYNEEIVCRHDVRDRFGKVTTVDWKTFHPRDLANNILKRAGADPYDSR